MDEGSESAAHEPLHPVGRGQHHADEPARARIAEGQQAPRPGRRRTEHAGVVGIAAHHAIQRHDIGGRHRIGLDREFRELETHPLRMPAPSRLVFGGCQVRRGGVDVGGRGEAVLQQHVMDRAYAPADVEQRRLGRERAGFDRREHALGLRIRTAALEASQLTPRGLGIEHLRRDAAVTAGHRGRLEADRTPRARAKAASRDA